MQFDFFVKAYIKPTNETGTSSIGAGISTNEAGTGKKCSSAHKLYKIIIGENLKDTFPNVKIILRIYLSLMITNCSGERSFSKLKFIKNRLRTSMSQEWPFDIDGHRK